MRLITLTLRQTDQDLTTILTRIMSCFRRLRRSNVWLRHVTGGVAFVEIVYRPASCTWHVHLHLLAEGTYFHKADLRAAWLLVTKDSFIVDLKLIRDPTGAADYVTKYVSKPYHATVISCPAALSEAIVALTGRRLFTTFGDWYGNIPDAEPDTTDWVPVAPLAEVLRMARDGSEPHRRILNNLESTRCRRHRTTPDHPP